MDPIIKFENFTWKYNAQAEPTLHEINLEIYAGEKVLICGPSGCGKSTLAHCLNGLIPFSYRGESSGSLTIFGKETKNLSIFDISKMVGTVLQDSDSQFVGLTVAEDIAFALENDCVPQDELFRRVAKVAEEVNVGMVLHHAPTELSGGQKQRVSLGGVMVDDVPIFLFDEPLANLDPATGKQAIELIDEIRKTRNATEIIIEHRLEDVLWRDVDRIVLMQDGRIAADVTPDQLLASDLLKTYGIREPLYITALKYAGVEITPEKAPHSIRSIKLPDEDIKAVRSWYFNALESTKHSESEILLNAEHITFAYDNGCKALDDVSIRVRKGEMLAIVGRNGAGKSTFSKLVCGFETPQKGSIHFRDKDLAKLSIKERADSIGYVMQNPNQMISQVMITDEVALGLKTRGVPEDEIKRRVEDTLKICGLYPFRKWPVSALSYGQKKRVTIASILVLDPEIIILDEPTAGQDFRHYTEIMEFLRDINRKGITVIMITHDMHLMLEYCDRAVVLADGKKLADTGCAAVLTDPDLIERASLKLTSLYDLAMLCGIDDAEGFVRCFIARDREVRA